MSLPLLDSSPPSLPQRRVLTLEWLLNSSSLTHSLCPQLIFELYSNLFLTYTFPLSFSPFSDFNFFVRRHFPGICLSHFSLPSVFLLLTPLPFFSVLLPWVLFPRPSLSSLISSFSAFSHPHYVPGPLSTNSHIYHTCRSS